MKKLSLEEILEGIEDTRRGNSVIYPLHEVLFIMLIAIICGATSYARRQNRTIRKEQKRMVRKISQA